jgi:hypothetical protein
MSNLVPLSQEFCFVDSLNFPPKKNSQDFLFRLDLHLGPQGNIFISSDNSGASRLVSIFITPKFYFKLKHKALKTHFDYDEAKTPMDILDNRRIPIKCDQRLR